MDRLAAWIVVPGATGDHLSALRAVEWLHLDGFDLRNSWGSGCVILARVRFLVRCDSYEGHFLGDHLQGIVREDALIRRRGQRL